MTKDKLCIATIFAILLWGGVTQAATPSSSPSLYDDTYWCRNGLFSQEGKVFTQYRIIVPKTQFLMDRWSGDTRCPNAAIPKCRWPRDLHAGQVVVANKVVDGFICAYRNGDAGWLPLSDVEKLEQASGSPSLSAWVGSWGDEDLRIRISRQGDHLHAVGTAYWPAKRYVQGRDGPYARHDGIFAANAVPTGNAADFTDHLCSVHAVLLGSNLLVSDNGNCGGVNVRFDGILPLASK